MIPRALAVVLLATLIGCGPGPEPAPGDRGADPAGAEGVQIEAGGATGASSRTEVAGVDGDGGVVVGGEVSAPYRLTPEILAGLPRTAVTAVDHGADTVRFRGVRVSDILARAGVELGTALRGPRMASYLLVEAADGYRAVFALAEIDPEFGHGEVYLVDEANGEPLGSEQGPFRIVAPGDARPARWV